MHSQQFYFEKCTEALQAYNMPIQVPASLHCRWACPGQLLHRAWWTTGIAQQTSWLGSSWGLLWLSSSYCAPFRHSGAQRHVARLLLSSIHAAPSQCARHSRGST